MARQMGFSVINILGLTIGITCCILIALYVLDELRYDKFHPDAARTYRMGFEGILEGKAFSTAQTAAPVARAIQAEIPEIESSLRLASWATFPVRYQEKTFTEGKLLLADSNFFRFFNFRLIAGSPDEVLHGKGKLVITESAARKYFEYSGKTDLSPIGKTMHLAQGYAVQISGIAEDPPPNSHFHFSMILSMNSWDDSFSSNWLTSRVITYFKLERPSSIEIAMSKINLLLQNNVRMELEKLGHGDLEQYKSQGNDIRFVAQALKDIHLHSHLSDEIETNGDIQYIYIFGSVGLLITILACINFMNLSTARSATRAKEIGVRKAVGAQQGKLILQFLLESYFFILLAIAFSILLAAGLLPVLNLLTSKHLGISTLLDPYFILAGVVFTFFVGLLAGSYPAFYLTQFNPIEVLNGKLRARLRSYGIRNVLVVFQFVISTVLIIATITVYLQLRYIQQANIGFDKANVINLLHTKNLGKNGLAFKTALLRSPVISSASYASRLPPNVDWQSVFRDLETGKEYLLSLYEMDADHLATMRYTMVAGRFFSSQSPADTSTVIINETAERRLGPGSALGKKLVTNYDHDGREREIIGIIKDFNFQSFREPVQPLAIVMGPVPNWEMAIRLMRGNYDEQLEIIRSYWAQFAPGAPFEYTFLDKNFEAKHRAEKRLGLISALFTALVIVIACLGLFGLAAFTAEQRTKEIGIRKVMGASVHDIITMINIDFLRPVLLANFIAWPLAGWLMYVWLQQFAFRISFPWWVFLAAGAISVLISFISISLQAQKAAVGNPVDSLRNE